MRYYIIPRGRQIADVGSVGGCNAKGSTKQCLELDYCIHCIFWDLNQETLEHLIRHKLIQEER